MPGHFIGGTEIRFLVGHGGKLYAGNGYWEDRPGPEGTAGRADPCSRSIRRALATRSLLRMSECRAASARPCHLCTERSQLCNRRDRPCACPSPVSLLVASTWDLSGSTSVFSRDDATGAWTPVTLAEDRPSAGFPAPGPELRHTSRPTDGIDLVFAGQNPRGVFSETMTRSSPGRDSLEHERPNWTSPVLLTSAFPGLTGRLRVSSFAECNGRLYAATGQQLYERIDGAAPHWRLVYTNSQPRPLRNRPARPDGYPDPFGNGQVLLVAVEGDAARIVRVDPNDASEAIEFDLNDVSRRQWRTHATYVIAAYNDMTKVRDDEREDLLLIGLEAFISPRAQVPRRTSRRRCRLRPPRCGCAGIGKTSRPVATICDRLPLRQPWGMSPSGDAVDRGFAVSE